METAIIYVRTDFWGAKAVQDLLAQERHCLAYANEMGCKVVKIYREKFRGKNRGIEIAKLLRSLNENSETTDYLIVQSPRALSRYKITFLPLLHKLKSSGLKVAFVIYKNKSHQTHEEKTQG